MQTLFEPLLLETPAHAALVFGLRWSPLVGSRPDLLARKRARLAGASHYVYGGNRSAAVGCTRLRQPPKACYSAAQLFALAHPDGMAAGLLAMSDARVWLVAAQDWLWPRLVVAQNGLWPAPNFLLYRLRGRFDAEGTAQGDLAQILPLPMLLFFLLAFLALQLLYLDRLVILAGRQEAKPHAGAGPTGAAATGAMPAGVAASALPQTDQNDVTERDPRQS